MDIKAGRERAWKLSNGIKCNLRLGSKLNTFEKVYVVLSISPSLKGNFCILQVFNNEF